MKRVAMFGDWRASAGTNCRPSLTWFLSDVSPVTASNATLPQTVNGVSQLDKGRIFEQKIRPLWTTLRWRNSLGAAGVRQAGISLG